MSRPTKTNDEAEGGKEPSSEAIRTITSQEIELPLRFDDWSVTGAAFPASLQAVNHKLPDGLKPIRIGPRHGVVALVGIQYHDVEDVEPYDGFGIMIPVTTARSRIDQAFSPLALFGTGWGPELEVYVESFPVTSEESRVLGTSVCGLYDGVADIVIEDIGQTRSITVRVDDEYVLSLETACARNLTWWRTLTGYTYAERDGDLLRARLETHGAYAVVPFSQQASYTLGDHPIANTIRSLDLGSRPLGRVYASEVIGRLHGGTPL